MDQIHKDALRRTRVALVKDLDVNVICNELLNKDIFTPLMVEHIMAEGTRNDKVCRLLDTLVEIGTNAYQAFLQVLKKTGYEFLANQIVQNEEMIRREGENPFISIPIQETNQPTEELRPASIPFELRNISAAQSSFLGSQIPNSNSSSLEASGYSTTIYSRTSEFSLPPSRSTRINREPQPVGLFDWEMETSYPVQPPVNENQSYSEELESMSSKYSLQSIEQRYTMNSNPRGAALIISNRRFENDHRERPGTEQDWRKLKLLYEELGFHVSVKEDLKRYKKLAIPFHIFP